MKHLNYLIASLLITLTSFPLQALESDRTEPIEIEANAATFNEKSGKSIYSGDVKVTQGSIKLWADTLTVFSKEGGMDKMIAAGKPAKFQQTPDNTKEKVHGSALRMEYFGSKSKLVMLKKAKLWQGKNSTSSERIEYDSLNSIIQAGKKSSSSQRVKVTLMPRKNSPKETK